MERIKEEVLLFWNKVQEKYSVFVETGGVAQKKDFYIFQTGYRHNPDLMIVGINPGGNVESDSKWLGPENNENWYVKGTHTWFQTLRNIFGYPENEVLRSYLENCVGSNKIFINTGNQNKIPKEIDSISTALIRELVSDIIKPKHIIALGVSPFYTLRIGKVEFKQFGKIKLKYAYRKETPICFIPNPSARNGKYLNSETFPEWQKAIEWFMKL